MKIQESNTEYNINGDRQKKNKKKVKRRIFWIKFILYVSLFSTITVLTALSPLFNIKHIEVDGSQHYNRDDIIGVTDIVPGKNGFKIIGNNFNIGNIILFRYKKAEKQILSGHPYIKTVTVRYMIPGTIRISLSERKPIGIIPFEGTNLIVDDDGYVVEAVNKTDNFKIPLINGIKFSRYEIGQALKIDNAESYTKAVSILETINETDKTDKFAISDLVKVIDVTDMKKINLLVDSRINVNIGDAKNLNYRLSFLRQIFSKSLKKEDKGYLDFSTGENPNFIPDR